MNFYSDSDIHYYRRCQRVRRGRRRKILLWFCLLLILLLLLLILTFLGFQIYCIHNSCPFFESSNKNKNFFINEKSTTTPKLSSHHPSFVNEKIPNIKNYENESDEMFTTAEVKLNENIEQTTVVEDFEKTAKIAEVTPVKNAIDKKDERITTTATTRGTADGKITKTFTNENSFVKDTTENLSGLNPSKKNENSISVPDSKFIEASTKSTMNFMEHSTQNGLFVDANITQEISSVKKTSKDATLITTEFSQSYSETTEEENFLQQVEVSSAVENENTQKKLSEEKSTSSTKDTNQFLETLENFSTTEKRTTKINDVTTATSRISENTSHEDFSLVDSAENTKSLLEPDGKLTTALEELEKFNENEMTTIDEYDAEVQENMKVKVQGDQKVID